MILNKRAERQRTLVLAIGAIGLRHFYGDSRPRARHPFTGFCSLHLVEARVNKLRRGWRRPWGYSMINSIVAVPFIVEISVSGCSLRSAIENILVGGGLRVSARFALGFVLRLGLAEPQHSRFASLDGRDSLAAGRR